jgi:Tol biopolymer transport system component
MPDVREVFRAATEKVRPDPGFLERQERRARRRTRNRRAGVIAVVAAIVFALLLVALTSVPGRRAEPATPAPTSASTAGESFFVDLGTDTTAPLPDRIAAEGWAYPVSPDGTKFTYTTCCDDGSPAVYVSNVDGSDVRLLIDGDAYGPQWSPDGARIVFHRYNGMVGDVYVVDPDTGHAERVTHISQALLTGGWWFTAPIFAPDGETILFHLPRYADGDYVWDLWSVPSAGGEETLVRRDAGFGSYSPNGRTLAYLSPVDVDHFDGQALWIVDVAGGPPRELAGGGRIAWPRWSPDGGRISYAQRGTIYVVDVATGVTTPVAAGGVAEWFDDDTLVVGNGN